MLEHGPLSSGRQCRKCRRIYPPEQVPYFFSRARALVRNGSLVNRYGPLELEKVCNVCLQNQRDARKQQNRYLDKAKRTLARHAAKYGFRPAVFAKRYGWDVKQMAHDIEHAEKNGCPYCHHLFAEMGHGLRDITLDIYSLAEEPYYTNTRWCCITCNSKKQGMPIKNWHQVCLAFKKQESFLPYLEEQAPIVLAPKQLSLFEVGEAVA